MIKSRIDDGYKRNLFLYKLLRPLLLIIVKIIYNPEIIGKDNILKYDGCVIASNHIHAFDPVILIYSNFRIVHFIAKKELFTGFMRCFYLSFGTIPVDRSKHNPVAVDLAVDFLKHGEVIGIFPEGTRNRTDEALLQFKYGAVRMAKESGKKIIPCAIIGNYKFFRRNLKICYGKAIDVSKLDIDDANNLLRNKVLELLEDN